ncbi:MAG: DUF92 domain-containing protein [Balneolaceae bacterium]|nr:DUF92 domain-containing protein [Balneolaceae bacterium]
MNWVTLDGASAASVLGIIILGLGGWNITILLLIFFVSSTLFSGRYIVKIEETAQAFAERARRNGVQVWSNGFWIAFCVVLSSIFDSDLFLMGAAGAVAVATADTWATELGSQRFNAKTYLITTFQKIKPQTDGGVSVPGTLAAITGSLIISIVAVLLFPIPWAAGMLTIF